MTKRQPFAHELGARLHSARRMRDAPISSRTFFRADERTFREKGGNLLFAASSLARRHSRRFAMLAALPAAPAAPLSQKSRCAAIFGSPVCFQGTPFIKSRRIHLHPNQVKAKGTRPERRLLRALRLILIAIPQWVLLLRLSPQSIAKCALSGCGAIASG